MFRFWQQAPKVPIAPGPVHFRDAVDAFSFIRNWDGDSVTPLLEAIHCARTDGGAVMQKYLHDALLDISRRVPLPAGVPNYVSDPILAVDRHGNVLLGGERGERISDLETILTDKARLAVDA